MDEDEFIARFRAFADGVLQLAGIVFPGDVPFAYMLIGAAPDASGEVEMIEVKSTMCAGHANELLRTIAERDGMKPGAPPEGVTLN